MPAEKRSSHEYVVYLNSTPIGMVTWAWYDDDFGPGPTPTELARSVYGHLRKTRQRLTVRNVWEVSEETYEVAKERQWENRK